MDFTPEIERRIDTQNDAMFKGSRYIPFPKHHFGYPAVFFRGCILVLVMGGRVFFVTPKRWHIPGDYILPTTLYKNQNNPLNPVHPWKMNMLNPKVMEHWIKMMFRISMGVIFSGSIGSTC